MDMSNPFAGISHLRIHLILAAYGKRLSSRLNIILIRTVGDTLLTFEHLNTYVIEIEGLLNSRPLTPLSSDPNDFQALTPAHFLIGESLTALPERDFMDVPANRLSVWQHIQKIKQHFWSRWHKEYINELNMRSKWKQDAASNLRINDLVLLQAETLPPLHWALGRIMEVLTLASMA